MFAHSIPMRFQTITALVATTAIACTSQRPPDDGAHAHHPAGGTDSAFHEVQSRGRTVMGVDQYTSTHRFEPLATGGRIELQRDADDSTGVRVIREHLQEVAAQFARGDFTAAETVHAQSVPGTDVMRARRDAIAYEYRPLPRGGEIRITTGDARAVAAIHEFLGFQRSDHRSGR